MDDQDEILLSSSDGGDTFLAEPLASLRMHDPDTDWNQGAVEEGQSEYFSAFDDDDIQPVVPTKAPPASASDDEEHDEEEEGYDEDDELYHDDEDYADEDYYDEDDEGEDWDDEDNDEYPDDDFSALDYLQDNNFVNAMQREYNEGLEAMFSEFDIQSVMQNPVTVEHLRQTYGDAPGMKAMIEELMKPTKPTRPDNNIDSFKNIPGLLKDDLKLEAEGVRLHDSLRFLMDEVEEKGGAFEKKAIKIALDVAKHIITTVLLHYKERNVSTVAGMVLQECLDVCLTIAGDVKHSKCVLEAGYLDFFLANITDQEAIGTKLYSLYERSRHAFIRHANPDSLFKLQFSPDIGHDDSILIDVLVLDMSKELRFMKDKEKVIPGFLNAFLDIFLAEFDKVPLARQDDISPTMSSFGMTTCVIGIPRLDICDRLLDLPIDERVFDEYSAGFVNFLTSAYEDDRTKFEEFLEMNMDNLIKFFDMCFLHLENKYIESAVILLLQLVSQVPADSEFYAFFKISEKALDFVRPYSPVYFKFIAVLPILVNSCKL